MASTNVDKKMKSNICRVDATQDFYVNHASRYAALTQHVDLSSIQERFANALVPGGTLLDVGCGGGRDLRAFRQKGFQAIGLEPSKPLATIARTYSGCEVRVGRVEDMTSLAEFDAVWACASLVHLLRTTLPVALAHIRAASKMGAVLFLSMQLGSGDFVAPDGRYYALYQPHKLASAVGAAGFDVLEIWQSGDSLEERPIRWVNLLARAGARSAHL